MRSARLTLLALVLASACDYGFKPESLVDSLRLLAVKSTPPDLRPGQTARLDALLLDPSGAPFTVLWLGCAPDPLNQNRSPCADADLLQDPSSLAGTGTPGSLPDGVSLIGFNSNVAYTAPKDLFEALAADDPRRQSGTVGQIVAFAVGENVSPAATEAELAAVFDRVKKKQTRSILALYRLKVSESTERNTNPVATGLTFDGQLVNPRAHLLVNEHQTAPIDVVAPDESFEPFTTVTPDGPQPKTERILAGWYSTSGRFSHVSTALREAVTTEFTAPTTQDPTNPMPEGRLGTLWAVLRDTRAGQSWLEQPFFVCDPSAGTPAVTQVEWPTASSEPVVVHGAQLDSILEVLVDGVALEKGAWRKTTNTWEGQLPTDVTLGVARGTIVTRGCATVPLAP